MRGSAGFYSGSQAFSGFIATHPRPRAGTAEAAATASESPGSAQRFTCTRVADSEAWQSAAGTGVALGGERSEWGG